MHEFLLLLLVLPFSFAVATGQDAPKKAKPLRSIGVDRSGSMELEILAEPLQVGMDNGARRALVPPQNMKHSMLNVTSAGESAHHIVLPTQFSRAPGLID